MTVLCGPPTFIPFLAGIGNWEERSGDRAEEEEMHFRGLETRANNKLKAVGIAPWFCLCLPICGPGFKYQANNL